MGSTDYRLDLLTPIETGFRIGANIRARNDAKARALQDAEREARELEARKAQLAQQALYQDQLLKLRENELNLSTKRQADEIKYQQDRLALENSKLFLDALPKPSKERTVGVREQLPSGAYVTRQIPESELDAYLATQQTPKPEKAEKPDRSVQVVQVPGEKPTITRRMTPEEYDEMAKRENAAIEANKQVGKIIGKWDRKTGFQRTTK